MTPVRGIQRPDLAEYWPAMEPLINAALEYDEGCYEACDILDELRSGDLQAFMADDCDLLIITKFVKYPRKTALHVFMVSGDLPDDWHMILSALETWAAENGCDMVRAKARQGWVKKLPDYRTGLIEMVKELRQ